MYQQAILDAKALRASAMANAKAALQEAFEPKIEEMVRLQLSEEFDENEELEETVEEMEEGKQEMEEGEEKLEGYHEDGLEETEDLEESELDEILAELESLSEEDIDEAEELEEGDMDMVDEADEEEESEEEVEVSDDAEGEEETQEITVSLGDLKSVIDAIKGLAPELASDEMADEEMADDESEEEDEEENISLDEILAELENEGKEKHPMAEKKMHKDKEKELDEKKEMEKELEEAKNTIQALQESMNEINLVNAKLLYMNKIFKAKSLTESQKIKVVKAFDRAASVKEVKNTYEVLKESVSVKKSHIQESFGYASKPAGVSPNANVIDSDPFVNRWQKLAGL